MPIHYIKKNSIGFSLPVVLILVSTFSLAAVSAAALTYDSDEKPVLGSKSQSGKSSGNSGNSNKSSDTKGKSNSSNSNKPVTNNTTSSPVTTTTTDQERTKVTGQLKKVANTERFYGNTEVADELDEIADTTDEDAEEVGDTIEAVEAKPAWKVFLFGADYKNLGQLRSSLVHNRNQITFLNRSLTKVQGTGSEAAIQEQIKLLEEEQAKITSVITENESQFSVLGWVAKLLAGYTPGDDTDTGTTTEPSDTLPIETEPTNTLPVETEPTNTLNVTQ